MLPKHKKYGHQLSDSMVHCIHTLLYGAMGAAEQFRLIPRNPVAEVTVPKRKLPPKQILNGEQLDTFLSAIQADDIWHDFFYTELTTGLRLGEICGLRWEDFDAEHGVLNIQRTVHVEKDGVLTTGDTKFLLVLSKIFENFILPNRNEGTRLIHTSSLHICSNNHFRKCASHPANKIPLAHHIGL